MEKKMTVGLIVGNRGFFPDHLCEEGKAKIEEVLKAKGLNVISLSEKDTKFGSVETLADTKKCVELFKKNRENIDGIIVTLPNFGDETAVADTIRNCEIDVPLLIHAWPDEITRMDIANRRDSFCGKISVCNNLVQYGIPFSLTKLHTVDPQSKSFANDLSRFTGICRVVKGLKNIKIGAIGTRPDAFKTVRYSEKILEDNGISVHVIDLSQIFSEIKKLDDGSRQVKESLEQLRNYTDNSSISANSLLKIAKLKAAIDAWINENELSGVAIQCWPSMQENYGIMPCAAMSMLSNSLVPAACEVDITGTLSMYVLQLVSGTPSAIVDWNNNYGEDENKTVFFHCSNLPVSFFEKSKMHISDIIAGTLGEENAQGTISGRIKPSPFTFLRLTTDDTYGDIRGYTGEGKITDDELDTFGGYGVAEIAQLQELMKFVCENGFEHHGAISLSETADTILEALEKYKGWEIHRHQ